MGHLKPNRPRLGTAIAVLALAVSLGGVAYATIPGSGGTIEGCYSPTNAKPPYPLSVVDSASDCVSPSVLLPFNQTGPTGPEGPAGSQGPAGNGSASGADVYHTTVSSPHPPFISTIPAGDINIPPGGRFDLTLNVPAGTYSIVADISLYGYGEVLDPCVSGDCFPYQNITCLLALGPTQGVIYVGAASSDSYTGWVDLGVDGSLFGSIPATISHTFRSPGWIHYVCRNVTRPLTNRSGFALVFTDTIVATKVLGTQYAESSIVPRPDRLRGHVLSGPQVRRRFGPHGKPKPKGHN